MNPVPMAPLEFCTPARGRVVKAALANCRQPLTALMSSDTPHLIRISSSDDRETCGEPRRSVSIIDPVGRPVALSFLIRANHQMAFVDLFARNAQCVGGI